MTKKVIVTAALLIGVLSLSATESHARKEYFEQFQKRYVGDKETDGQKKLAVTLERMTANKQNCFICHDPKRNADGIRSKKNRNAYGKLLDASGLSKTTTRITFGERKDAKIVREKTALIIKGLQAAETKKLPGMKRTVLQILGEGNLPGTYKPTELE